MPALAQQLAGDSLITYLQTQNSPISQTFSNSHRRNFTGKWKSEESHLAVAGVLLAKRKITERITDALRASLQVGQDTARTQAAPVNRTAGRISEEADR